MRKALLAVCLLLFVGQASAMQISEIMYDLEGNDAGREWIEIYNNNSEAVNLTGWKFFEGGTNHGLNLINGSWLLEQGSYAVIAEDAAMFLEENGNFSGTLFDSSFSLSNTGEPLVLKNSSLDVVESVNYSKEQGAAGDGNSLQLVNGSWCGSEPTPGADNLCAQEQQANNDTNKTNKTSPVQSFSVSITDAPSQVSQGETFKIQVQIANNFNTSVSLSVYSYVFKSKTLASEGGWKPNEKDLLLDAGESLTIELENTIRQDAEPGTYSLRARAVVNGSDYDSTEELEVIQAPAEKEENITLQNLTATNIAENRASKPSAEKKQENRSAEPVVWERSSLNLPLLLIAAALLVLAIGLLASLVNFKRQHLKEEENGRKEVD